MYNGIKAIIVIFECINIMFLYAIIKNIEERPRPF